jgi:hypothetical protein
MSVPFSILPLPRGNCPLPSMAKTAPVTKAEARETRQITAQGGERTPWALIESIRKPYLSVGCHQRHAVSCHVPLSPCPRLRSPVRRFPVSPILPHGENYVARLSWLLQHRSGQRCRGRGTAGCRNGETQRRPRDLGAGAPLNPAPISNFKVPRSQRRGPFWGIPHEFSPCEHLSCMAGCANER